MWVILFIVNSCICVWLRRYRKFMNYWRLLLLAMRFNLLRKYLFWACFVQLSLNIRISILFMNLSFIKINFKRQFRLQLICSLMLFSDIQLYFLGTNQITWRVLFVLIHSTVAWCGCGNNSYWCRALLHFWRKSFLLSIVYYLLFLV